MYFCNDIRSYPKITMTLFKCGHDSLFFTYSHPTLFILT